MVVAAVAVAASGSVAGGSPLRLRVKPPSIGSARPAPKHREFRTLGEDTRYLIAGFFPCVRFGGAPEDLLWSCGTMDVKPGP